jgi:hypothetical protein
MKSRGMRWAWYAEQMEEKRISVIDRKARGKERTGKTKT